MPNDKPENDAKSQTQPTTDPGSHEDFLKFLGPLAADWGTMHPDRKVHFYWRWQAELKKPQRDEKAEVIADIARKQGGDIDVSRLNALDKMRLGTAMGTRQKAYTGTWKAPGTESPVASEV